jgi:predicted TIM-barrel fold metal-dependent hydrolase
MLGRIFALLVFAFYGFWGQANGQNAKSDPPATQPEAKPGLALGDFHPETRLRVPGSTVTRAKFSVVDVHSHFRIKLRPTPNALDEFVDLMNRQNIAIAVSLDGTLGPILDEHLQYLWKNHKSRFIVFANIDWQGDGKENEPATWDCNQSDFVHRTVLALQAARQKGISGLKLFKQFGLNYRNSDGSYIAIDDPRFDPIWETCGQLGIPVIMHTADPSAFFEPITARNERYEELSRHPDWHFPSDKFPTRSSLHAARNRIIERHRSTTFIGAHMANDAEDLVETSQLLDAHPNLYIELASRISELGRQPYSARDFLIKYQDRVMFGTDGPWPEPRYRSYWRFLETRDEYFPYAEKPFPPQGFWQIYGVHLPDDVLKKIYSENAKKAIPGVKERL